jgi:hypothetical protein
MQTRRARILVVVGVVKLTKLFGWWMYWNPASGMSIVTRGLSADNKVNIIIGVLIIVIGILSAVLAWATWRLTRDRRRRHQLRGHGHGHESMFLSLCDANLSLSCMALEFCPPHTFMSDLLCFQLFFGSFCHANINLSQISLHLKLRHSEALSIKHPSSLHASPPFLRLRQNFYKLPLVWILSVAKSDIRIVGPAIEDIPLATLPSPGPRLGYELALRFGRSL